MYTYYSEHTQGCHTSVTAACATLDSLRTKDGTLPLYLQPYAGPQTGEKIPLADRAVQTLGPFVGTMVVSYTYFSVILCNN
jgi:hypothetical protein